MAVAMERAGIGGQAAALAASVAGHGLVLAVVGAVAGPGRSHAAMIPFGTEVDVSFESASDSAVAPETPAPAVVEPDAVAERITAMEASSAPRPSRASARRAIPRSAPRVPAAPAPPHLGAGIGELAETGDVEVSPGPIGVDPGPMRSEGQGIQAIPLPPSAPGPAGSTPTAAELGGAIAGLSLAQCFPRPPPEGTDRTVRVHVLYLGSTGRPTFAGIMNVPFAGTAEGACVVRELTRIAHVRPFRARHAEVVYDLRY
jgi:hypothetical protein